MDIDAVKSLRNRYRDDLRALPGVVGLGIGHDGGAACLRVYLDLGAPIAAYERLIPIIEGVPVTWIVTGPITAIAQENSSPEGREVRG